jgi:hypothetical protein
MIENIITLKVKDLPYKKMKGFLKNHKINPDNIALKVEYSSEFTRFTPLLNWQNYLPFSHKVTAILLFKIDNIYLFVGHSNNGETIIYNDEFSKFLLNLNSKDIVKSLPEKKQVINKTLSLSNDKITRIDILLDKINKMGLSFLSKKEREELETLSKKLNLGK